MPTDNPERVALCDDGTVHEPADFDTFWKRTIAAARREPFEIRFRSTPTALTTIDVDDITFQGFGGAPIRAWLRRPKVPVDQKLPVIVEIAGYGGGRGLAEDSLFWASAGFIHLQMDTRGQGAGWSRGDTPDPVGSGPHAPGMMTAGIESRDSYYYRRLITDAVRAIDAARHLPGADPSRIYVHGISQGGGVAIAAAALSENIAGVYACVPFLCDIPRAVKLAEEGPYLEIVNFLAVHRGEERRTFDTLAYFDAVTFARRCTAPTVVTVALMDSVCPPPTVITAYNACAASSKELWEHPFNGHEGGGTVDHLRFVSLVQTQPCPGVEATRGHEQADA